MRTLIGFVVAMVLTPLMACSLSRSLGPTALASEEQAVLHAEHEWVNVTLQGNVDAFSSFMADEYLALLPGGRIRDKATWVSALRAGTSKYESVNLSNLRVRVYGNTAVVFGEYTQKATADGKDNSAAGKYVDTWIKRDGRWQVVASGFSRIPAQ